jgi:hypothetical protein
MSTRRNIPEDGIIQWDSLNVNVGKDKFKSNLESI